MSHLKVNCTHSLHIYSVTQYSEIAHVISLSHTLLDIYCIRVRCCVFSCVPRISRWSLSVAPLSLGAVRRWTAGTRPTSKRRRPPGRPRRRSWSASRCAFKLRVPDQSQLDSSGLDTLCFYSIPLDSSCDWSGTRSAWWAPWRDPSVDTPLRLVASACALECTRDDEPMFSPRLVPQLRTHIHILSTRIFARWSFGGTWRAQFDGRKTPMGTGLPTAFRLRIHIRILIYTSACFAIHEG